MEQACSLHLATMAAYFATKAAIAGHHRPAAYAIEYTSVIHSVVAVGISVLGLIYQCPPGSALDGFAHIHSCAYFAYDLYCNCAGQFDGGFSRAFALHHAVALVLLWPSWTLQFAGIFWGLLITEVTNPIRGIQVIYLKNNDYSVAARNSRFNRWLKGIFAVTFITMRVGLLPLFSVYWYDTNHHKIPGPVTGCLLFGAAAMLIAGGFWWSRLLIYKCLGVQN